MYDIFSKEKIQIVFYAAEYSLNLREVVQFYFSGRQFMFRYIRLKRSIFFFTETAKKKKQIDKDDIF